MKHDVRTQAAIDTGHLEWAELPAARKDAKALGSTRYFTGKACKKGHVAQRFAGDGSCCDCAREYAKTPKMLAYQRAYRREYDKTPKARAYQREYEKTSDRRAYNREYKREYDKTPEARANRREYAKTPKMREYKLAYNAQRRASKLDATPHWLTDAQQADMRAVYAEAARLTEATGVQHHVDHIIPLTHPDVCGLHIPANLQILTESENCSKGNSFDGTMENDGWRGRAAVA